MIDDNTAGGNLTQLRSSPSVSPCRQGDELGTPLSTVGIHSLPMLLLVSWGFNRSEY